MKLKKTSNPEMRRILVFAFFSGMVPLLYVLLGFGFSLGNVALPLHGSLDELLYATNVKALMTSGTSFNPTFGGFGGQDLNFALVSVDLGAPYVSAFLAVLFHSTPFFGMNLLFILSFPLTSIIAFESFRRIGANLHLSALGAVVYATLGFHSFWNTDSITISNYWYLAPCIALFLALISGKLVLDRSKFGVWKKVSIFTLALLSGSFYSYWAFGLVAIYLIWMVAAVAHRVERRNIISASIFTATTLLGFVLVSIPSLVSIANSKSSINYLGARHYSAGFSNGNTLTSYFNYSAGSLSEKLLSIPFHDFREKMDSFLTLMLDKGFYGESLSYAQAIPLGILIAILLVMISRKRFLELESYRQFSRINVGLLFIGVLFFASLSAIGGLGPLFSMFGSSALRGFGRFYIFTVLFLVFIVVLSASSFSRKNSKRGFAFIFTALLTLASFENLSIPIEAKASQEKVLEINSSTEHDSPNISVTRSTSSMISGVEKLNSKLESRVKDCTILSLPITHYPYESPGYTTYRLLLPGLVSDKLHWTAGAVGGSPSFDNLLPLRDAIDSRSSNILTITKESGFCAVVLDATAWNAMHHFKPWPDYVGHPVPTISEFLASNSGEWNKVATEYGDYFVLYF